MPDNQCNNLVVALAAQHTSRIVGLPVLASVSRKTIGE
jgi:hypothetical protein